MKRRDFLKSPLALLGLMLPVIPEIKTITTKHYNEYHPAKLNDYKPTEKNITVKFEGPIKVVCETADKNINYFKFYGRKSPFEEEVMIYGIYLMNYDILGYEEALRFVMDFYYAD